MNAIPARLPKVPQRRSSNATPESKQDQCSSGSEQHGKLWSHRNKFLRIKLRLAVGLTARPHRHDDSPKQAVMPRMFLTLVSLHDSVREANGNEPHNLKDCWEHERTDCM